MKLNIAMVAWPNSPTRLEYFKRCMGKLIKGLSCLGHGENVECQFIVSAETERVEPAILDELKLYCSKSGILLNLRRKPANLGGNMNDLLEHCDGDFVLLTQDDWELTGGFDIGPYIGFLQADPEFAMVRLAYSIDPVHTFLGPPMYLRKTGPGAGLLTLRYQDPRSAYFYGDQPHVRRGPGHGELPRYTEEGKLGDPELQLNGYLQQSRWRIACSNYQVFEHCGIESSVAPDMR